MPAFSISPASASTPPTSAGFPNYMQIQAGGEDLGTPTVDTLNFGSGLTATRGTGENANRVTVTGEGGGPQTLMLSASVAGFAGQGFQYVSQNVLVESSDAYWNAEEGRIYFETSGFYRIIVSVQVAALSGAWQESSMLAVSRSSGGQARYSRAESDGYLLQFPLTNEAVFYVGREIGASEGIIFDVNQFEGQQEFVGDLTIEVQRIGDYVPT